MEKNVISRREFFKGAAKKALPIVGAVVLASMPNIAKAGEPPYIGCNGCSKTCSGACDGGCRTSCNDTCKETCKTTCVTISSTSNP